MADYKIGDILMMSADVELKDFLGDKTLVNKGIKFWVGADNLAHCHGTVQSLPKDSTVKGYNTKGIAERILSQLNTNFPLDEMCEEYEIELKDIKDSIEYALEELGLC